MRYNVSVILRSVFLYEAELFRPDGFQWVDADGKSVVRRSFDEYVADF